VRRNWDKTGAWGAERYRTPNSVADCLRVRSYASAAGRQALAVIVTASMRKS
jgi:hypothetical protein